MPEERGYRGRLAPSPTGYLHLGHARTFWIAAERARGGTLVLRNEDLDQPRSRPEFVRAMYEDLRWLGLEWQEGPDVGGPYGPYSQSERRESYLAAWRKLRDAGVIYPCTCSRKDLAQAAQAPHDDADEMPYPGTCRGRLHAREWERPTERRRDAAGPAGETPALQVSWRFHVPEGEAIRFEDALAGPQEFVGGRDLGDFLVWRRDDVPGYQLACVVDDAAMKITEVVRGADLLKSTARQLLLYRALGIGPPRWAHAPLMVDEHGVRLAKRYDALSLRELRAQGLSPEQVRARFEKDKA
jgi:glutamyl-tRNA synthetase